MLTKEKVLKLRDPDITKKEYDNILKEIDEKVHDIWYWILTQQNRKYEWYAYDNDIEYANGNGSSGGFFDPEMYSEFIHMTGDASLGYYLKLEQNQVNSLYKEFDYTYQDRFPTELLWDEDYKNTIVDHILKEKNIIQNSKNKKEQTKTNYNLSRIELAKSVKAKLTPEELRFVKTKFKPKELEILNS